jgi:chromosome segregation ATPase
MLCKKFIVTAAGLLLVGGVVMGTEAYSYLTTGWNRASRAVQEQVPVSFELDRARNMLPGLDQEIERCMHTVAKEEAAIEQLEKDVDKRQAALSKAEQSMMKLRGDLATGKNEYEYGGRKYSVVQVKTDLASRLAACRTRKGTIDNMGQILNARRSGLDAARQKLAEMQSARTQLVVDIENLEAKLKMVEVAQTAAGFKFDDSNLSRTRELVADVSARLDVMSKLSQLETTGGEIPVDAPTAVDITDQVADYFGESTGDAAKVANVSTNEAK